MENPRVAEHRVATFKAVITLMIFTALELFYSKTFNNVAIRIILIIFAPTFNKVISIEAVLVILTLSASEFISTGIKKTECSRKHIIKQINDKF